MGSAGVSGCRVLEPTGAVQPAPPEHELIQRAYVYSNGSLPWPRCRDMNVGVHARHWRALSHRSGGSDMVDGAGLPSCLRWGSLRCLSGSIAQGVCAGQRQVRFQRKSQKK
ncbi:hypothetical protein ALP98_102853 [Pseudomonas viridiflava]|uniref:Uncharacterized protein n=3 Tax=Pseudomonas syringae group TaxID=136849 RepID=A0A3M4P544_PSEVI|nr:hypothetical protein ALQ30_102265 [Pseudomonas syringae pv. persicae]RMP78573.1 hypothetical protein ALQ15_115234 [Pseudomonas syringae pv. actinidiae]RMQ73353.1 hypothetical protein ALP98_102853 [Pseudomonas viridiflava]